VILKDIPKIPFKYEPLDRMFFGFDTEDNAYGIPHFYQFAWRDGVVFSHSFRLLYRWVTQRFQMLKKNKHIVWCTNLEYDLGNITKDWETDSESLDIRWRRGKLAKAILQAKREDADWMDDDDLASSKMMFWDTMNHWPISVEKQGNILSKEIGYDFSKLKKDFYAFKYSAMDAIISRSYAAVQAHGYAQRNIPLKLTPGASAFEWYMKGETSDGTKFCNQKIYNTHTDEELDWLKQGVRGGRTEVFNLQEYRGKIGYFDINSAYPFSMKHESFPFLSRHFWVDGHKEIEKYIFTKHEGMAEVEVDATNVDEFTKYIPYLGTLDQSTLRLLFPLGRWRDRYTFYEIREAQEYGYRFKYIKALVYPISQKHPFKDYIDAAYALRIEGKNNNDTVLSGIGKSLGNNLYGKFGQRMTLTKLDDPANYPPEVAAQMRHFGNSVITNEDKGYARQTNMIWSAYITAICRSLLYNHMKTAWRNGNEILYCDTDSIFIAGGTWPESDDVKLGALKFECELSMFQAKLPKTYTYETAKGDTVFKAKGVPTAQRQKFFEVGFVEYQKPIKIRESLVRKTFKEVDQKKGIVPGIPAVNAWVTVHKNLAGAYTKRVTMPDGTTVPVQLNGIDNTKKYNKDGTIKETDLEGR
jgi:hypothetical protein